MITSTCRNCESWTEKDIIYAIGCFKNNKLEILWLIYGDCYAASRETYEKIKNKITQGVSEISSVEFSVTKELGRFNKIDPLGITDLRIRGMWQIENPRNVYNYLDIDYKLNKSFRLLVLIQETKYLSFPIEDRQQLESLNNPDLVIKDIKIKLPDNPIKLISAKLINYQIEKSVNYFVLRKVSKVSSLLLSSGNQTSSLPINKTLQPNSQTKIKLHAHNFTIKIGDPAWF